MRIGLYLYHRFGGASRAVSEDPLSGFLLIVRTDRIVTAQGLPERVEQPDQRAITSTAGASASGLEERPNLIACENLARELPTCIRGPLAHGVSLLLNSVTQ